MMTDDNDGLGTDREEDPTQQKHPRSVVIYYNKGETYFSKPHLIARRMNGRVVPLPSSVQRQTSCIWCCQREREVHLPLSAQRQTSCIWCCQRDHLDPGQKHSRHGQKQLGCVQHVTYRSVKCRDTTGRAVFISSTNQRHCYAEAQGIQVSKCSQSNRWALPSRPVAAGGHDDYSARSTFDEYPAMHTSYGKSERDQIVDQYDLH